MGQAMRKAFLDPTTPSSLDVIFFSSPSPSLTVPTSVSTTTSSTDLTFPDLSELPPELAVSVLRHLDATDLSLAGCVWQQFATDEILWSGLCRRQWNHVNMYETRNPSKLSARSLYLILDEGTLTFNSDFQKGMDYFLTKGIIRDDPEDIARFFDGTSALSKREMRRFLQNRSDVACRLVSLQNYSSQSLPNALRKLFFKMEAPEDRGSYIQQLLGTFSRRFCQCNPKFGYSEDFVYVTCFSLILLSVDLTSPHVKNKMSKREFIRNTRNAVGWNDNPSMSELFGEMYDNVFLRGHVSCGAQEIKQNTMPFVPGYLALFL